MVIFRTFSEKVDFTKIGVSPRREHDFWGPDPSKNSKKSMKKSCYFWTSYFSRFFTNLGRFGVPKWSKNGKNYEGGLVPEAIKKQIQFFNDVLEASGLDLRRFGSHFG